MLFSHPHPGWDLRQIDGNWLAQGTYHWQTTWPKSNCSYPTGHKEVHASKQLTGEWWNEWHEFAVEHTTDHLAYVYDGAVSIVDRLCCCFNRLRELNATPRNAPTTH